MDRDVNAIGIVRQMVADGQVSQEVAEKYFPELKESEESEDERIRKELIEYIKDQQSSFISAPDCRDEYEEEENNKYNSWIAWLEKQGEQKPADKVEPKFKVGDWVVVDDGRTGRIIECTKDFADVDLEFSRLSTSPNNIRSWTIQDVKDGDVLAAHECYVIFKEIDGLNIKCYCTYHYMGSNPSFYVDTLQNKEAFHPATKEQRDTLFAKMKEAGHEWDAELKQLRKIDQKPEEKPLISLKDFQDAFELKAKQYNIELPNRGYDIHAMCKELYSLLIQPKQKWSEEDEKTVHLACEFIRHHSRKGDSINGIDCTELVKMLESLKDRYTWKPSEYELKVLKLAAEKDGACLMGLYEDLKKLREG